MGYGILRPPPPPLMGPQCWFLRRRENRSTWGKTSPSRVENKQTRSIYGTGNRSRSECSNHCAIPAPRSLHSYINGSFKQTQPLYGTESGNRSGAHSWKASALTTARSPVPALRFLHFYINGTFIDLWPDCIHSGVYLTVQR